LRASWEMQLLADGVTRRISILRTTQRPHSCLLVETTTASVHINPLPTATIFMPRGLGLM